MEGNSAEYINEKITSDIAILVVDDNEINLYVISELVCALYGVRCDLADSGPKALEQIKQKDYDIVFMDHMMPKMDGVQTTKAIRAMGGQYKDLVIVALTANSEHETKQMLMEEGMNDFISKPVRHEDLKRILEQWSCKNICPEKHMKYVSERTSDISKKIINNPVLKKAAEIEALDINEGLKNVVNRQDVYEKSLRLLSEKIPDYIWQMEETFHKTRLPEFSVCVHTIKGSLANVGVVMLSKQAQELESESRILNYKYCRKAFPEFMEQLKEFGKQLHDVFGTSADSVIKEKRSDTVFERSLKRIEAALEDFDYISGLETMEILLKYEFSEPVNQKIKILKEYLDVFDYDAASAYIKKWNK